MHCTQCGTQTEEHFRFCQDCGAKIETSRREGDTRTATDRMEWHFQTLGWLFIGSGVLTGVLSGGVFIAGRLLREIPLPIPPTALGPDAEGLITLLMIILGVVLALTAVVSVAAGIGILQYQTWGRVMALTAAALIITKIPIGTAIGIYAFWVLLSAEGRQHFRARVPQTSA